MLETVLTMYDNSIFTLAKVQTGAWHCVDFFPAHKFAMAR